MKKIVSILLALSLSVGTAAAFAGCSNSTSVANTETDIQFSFWKSGFGDEYMKATIAAFKEEYPQYNVIFESSTDGFVFGNTIELGADYNTIDLYATSVIDQPYNEYAEPLDDILTATIPGESKPIGEKMIPEVRDGMKYSDGHHYGLSYSGALEGIVYNKEIIDGVKYKVPRTTQELEYLVYSLMDDPELKNVKPFIHFSGGGYWNRVYKTWQVQYDGLDYYYNTFLPLKDGDTAPSKNVIVKEDGRKKALEVLDRIISTDSVVSGSNGLVYTNAQTMFMNGSAVMMVTGNWLVNEMKSNTEATATDLKMMKTPVISSIREKTPSILDDTELCALIDAIDAAESRESIPLEGTGYKVEQADLNRVYEARNLMSSNFDGHAFIIPEYSNAKEAAKDFIKFCYSDTAIKLFYEYTHSAYPAALSTGTINSDDWLEFEKTAVELTENSIPILQEAVPYRSILFTYGGLKPFGTADIIGSMSVEQDRKDATALWSEALKHFDNWDTFLSNAGLK